MRHCIKIIRKFTANSSTQISLNVFIFFQILLDAGAQVNPVLRTSRNVFMTPLDCALQRGFRSTAKFLQLHGGVPASRLAELRNQPTSALNLHIRDDVTLLGDSSSESEKEDVIKSGKKSYKKKIAHKLEKPKLHLSGSEEETERLKSSKLESAGKAKKRSSERSREKKSSAKTDSPTPPTSSTKRSNRKLPSSRMEYTNEIIINGKTEINIHQTREIIVEKEPIVVDKVQETVASSETAVPRSASSIKDRRPRSAKFSKGRDRSGRASAEKEPIRSRNSVTSPETVIQQEKESRHPSLKTQSTNTSEETTETVIENKKIEPTMSTIEDGFLKGSKKVVDQQSLMSNTSEDVEDHKEFVVEASIHEPPKSHMIESDHEEVKEETENITDVPTEEKEEDEKTVVVDSQQADTLKDTKTDDTNVSLTANDIDSEQKAEDQKSEDIDIDSSEVDKKHDIEDVQEQELEVQAEVVVPEDVSKDHAEDEISEAKHDIHETDLKDTSDLQPDGQDLITKEKDRGDMPEPSQETQSTDEIEETKQHAAGIEETGEEMDKTDSQVLNETEAKEDNGQVPINGSESEPTADQPEQEVEKTVVNLPELEKSKDHDATDKTDKDEAAAFENALEDQTAEEHNEEKKIETISDTLQKEDDEISKTDVPLDKVDADGQHEQITETVHVEELEPQSVTEKGPMEGEVIKKRTSKQKESQKNQVIESSNERSKVKDSETKKKHLKADKTNKKPKEQEDYSDDDYSSRSEDASLSTPTRKTHKSFRILDEGEIERPSKTKLGKTKKSEKKESRSRSEENKKKDNSKEKFRQSKIPTPLGKSILSKSDRHLDKTHLSEKRALQGVLDTRVPSLPNIHQGKGRLKEPPRSESNMSAPPPASLYSDNESISDAEHESRSLVARNKKRVKKRPKVRDARSAGSDYESSNLIDSGFEPSPRSTRIPKWRNMSDRGVNMASVTQNIQSNIRR